MPTPLFKKGQSGNPAGAKPGNHNGAGRKPDWFKEKCRKIVQDDKLVEFLGKVARGENVDFITTIDGKMVPVPAKVKDRITAATELMDRGFGKPTPMIDIPENANGRFIVVCQ